MAVAENTISSKIMSDFFIIISFLTMCRALFIQNEKADIIHRIPLTSSNQFSFPACTHLNIYAPPIHDMRGVITDLVQHPSAHRADQIHPHTM